MSESQYSRNVKDGNPEREVPVAGLHGEPFLHSQYRFSANTGFTTVLKLLKTKGKSAEMSKSSRLLGKALVTLKLA